MCGRLVQQEARAIPARFGATVAEEARALLRPRFNLAPGQPLAIIVESAPGERRAIAATWGLRPRVAAAGREAAIFNLRAETLPERASYRRLLGPGRCLIPADGFYLWEQVGRRKFPWLYSLGATALFAFAGVYTRLVGPDGRERAACALLTVAANELVLPVQGRMPALLPREDEAAWLDPRRDDPAALVAQLSPYPASGMARLAVSPAVNSGRRDDARLVLPYAA